MPHKVALRIRDCIRFTVKLEGGSPDMDIDKQTSEFLESIKNDKIMKGREYDYESVPILRDYKINQLENIIT